MSGIETAHETVRTSGPLDSGYSDLNTLKAGFNTVTGLIQGNGGIGAFDLLNEITSEQDGFVAGVHQGEARVGFQEETHTEVLDSDGNVISSQRLTYGAYAEADGDIALGVSAEGMRAMNNGTLSFGAALDVATDEITGRAAAQRVWETDLTEGSNGISSYSVAGGFNFSAPINGGETDWNAAFLGDVTYDHSMLSQFGVYAFAEAGVIADPSNVDAIARAGFGKDTNFGDLRVGVNQGGSIAATLGVNF